MELGLGIRVVGVGLNDFKFCEIYKLQRETILYLVKLLQAGDCAKDGLIQKDVPLCNILTFKTTA